MKDASSPVAEPLGLSPPSLQLLDKLQKLLNHDLSTPQLLARTKEDAALSSLFRNREHAVLAAEHIAQSNTPINAMKVLTIAGKFKQEITPSAYERVVHALAQEKRWKLVMYFLNLCKRNTGVLTGRLLNWKARVGVETQNYNTLGSILEDFHREGLVPDRRTYNLLISGFLKNRDLPRAKDALQAMSDAGLSPDASTYAIVSSVHRRLAPDENVAATAFSSLTHSTPSQATLLLNTYLRNYISSGDAAGMARVYRMFDQASISPGSLDPHRVVADIFPEPKPTAESDSDSAPLSVTLPPYPIKPDATTFHLLVDYMANNHELVPTLRMVQRMQLAGYPPDGRAVGSLIKAYFRHGYPSTGLQIAINACVPAGIPRESWGELLPDTIPELPPLSYACVQPDLALFEPLFEGLITYYGPGRAQLLLGVMEQVGLGPGSHMIRSVLVHLDKVAGSRPGTLLRVLRRLTRGSQTATLNHLHIILSSVIRREKTMIYPRGWNAPASRFSRKRVNTSVQSPAETRLTATTKEFDPSAGIGAAPSASYRNLFAHILQNFSARQLKSDSALFALRLRRDAVNKQDVEQAKEVFRTLLARGIEPSPYHFSAIMEGCAMKGDMNEAEEVFQQFTKAGHTPTVVMFTILIVGYARQGRPRATVKTFQRMTSLNIKPDIGSIDAVICAFFAVGAYAFAKQMLMTLWPYIAPFPVAMRNMSLQELAIRFRGLQEVGKDISKDLQQGQRAKLYMRVNMLMKKWAQTEQQAQGRTRLKPEAGGGQAGGSMGSNDTAQ